MIIGLWCATVVVDAYFTNENMVMCVKLVKFCEPITK